MIRWVLTSTLRSCDKIVESEKVASLVLGDMDVIVMHANWEVDRS